MLGEMGYTGKQQQTYQGHAGDDARGEWGSETGVRLYTRAVN